MSIGRRMLAKRVRVLLSLLVISSLLVHPAGPVRAQQTPAAPTPTAPPSPRVDQTLVRQLSQESGGAAHVEYHRETGMVRFIGTDPGRPVARSARAPANATPEVAARSFLTTYAPLFGVKDQSRELKVKRERAADDGRSILRFTQQHNGIPVFAGTRVPNEVLRTIQPGEVAHVTS